MIPNPLFDPLKDILTFNRRRIYIDNVFSRIHYVWTVFLLVGFVLMILYKLYIGQPINCMSSPEIKDIVNEYCYIHSTFTRGKFEKGTWIYEPVKSSEIYPGIRPAVRNDRLTVHHYYQWVWIVLSLQAVSFFFPHWVWEKLERGTTMMLVGDLNLPMMPDVQKHKQVKRILLYFRRNRGYHRNYAFSYSMSELANLINVILQMYITDYFLDNAFSTYGLKVFELTQEKPYERDDKLARVFPTVTACRLATGGVAFGKVQHDILCVLGLNIINEKIYIFLWFWYIFVLISSILCLIYRLMTLSIPFRIWMLKQKVRRKERKECIEHLCLSNTYGTWFLIYKLSQNMDTFTFGILIEDIDQAFRKWDADNIGHDEQLVLDAPPASPPEVSPLHPGQNHESKKKKHVVVNLEVEGTGRGRRKSTVEDNMMNWDEEVINQNV